VELDVYLKVLRRGGIVACPTETLQGLLADALDAAAVQRVVQVKQRGPDPIALILPHAESLDRIAVEVSAATRSLAEKHWPGPLTLLVRAHPTLAPELVRDGKVGVRIPGPSPALDLVRAFGGPLTATSANPSGQPPARTEAEARAYFVNVIDEFLPGDAPGGAPSTVVDATVDPPRVIRPGSIAI